MVEEAGGTDSSGRSVLAVVAAIVGVLLLFLLVLSMGEPIFMLSGNGASYVYAIAVYAPVLLVCALAVIRSRRG